MKSNQESSQIK